MLQWGQSPVLIAAVFNQKEVIKQCLSKGVSADKLRKVIIVLNWCARNDVYFFFCSTTYHLDGRQGGMNME